MLLGSSRKICSANPASIMVHGCEVDQVLSFKYIGITYSSNMTWSDHVDNMTSKIEKRLGLLKRIKHLLPKYARILFYNSFVLPVFHYGDIVWGDKDNAVLMRNLQMLQNKAAKIIMDCPFYSSVSDALGRLNWSDLSRKRHYNRCLYIFKILNDLSISNITLTTIKDTHRYNTRNRNNFRLPAARKNWGKQKRNYNAVKDWNSLDESIRNAQNVSIFKRNYFNYFKIIDN